jgi:hypothetical protein
VLPLAVAVAAELDGKDIAELDDLARTCASDVVVVEATAAPTAVVAALLEAIRRSDARRH